jgi:hypothetical protein
MNDPFDFDAMLSDLSAGRRFGFVRYSDGDWNCIVGKRGGITDQVAGAGYEHAYHPDLAAALLAALVSEPGYHVGIMDGLMQPGAWWASQYVIDYMASHPDLATCSSLILHHASRAGRLGEFFEALRGWPVTVVSHAGMASMTPWLGEFEHVVIPEANCWRARSEIEPRIIEACRAQGVALFSCSMPAKVWIRMAWESRCGATLIDIGSVFDPYVGRMSRGYMREGKAVLAARLY